MHEKCHESSATLSHVSDETSAIFPFYHEGENVNDKKKKKNGLCPKFWYYLHSLYRVLVLQCWKGVAVRSSSGVLICASNGVC